MNFVAISIFIFQFKIRVGRDDSLLNKVAINYFKYLISGLGKPPTSNNSVSNNCKSGPDGKLQIVQVILIKLKN